MLYLRISEGITPLYARQTFAWLLPAVLDTGSEITVHWTVNIGHRTLDTYNTHQVCSAGRNYILWKAPSVDAKAFGRPSGGLTAAAAAEKAEVETAKVTLALRAFDAASKDD
jgi:hypothetical protein